MDDVGGGAIPDVPANAHRLGDLEFIRSLALSFCAGLDQENVSLLKSVFWPDATDDHGTLFQGLAWDFAEYVVTQRERVRPTLHTVTNHHVSFDASDQDSATGLVYGVGYQFAHALPTRRTRIVVGWYEDVYRRRSGEWKIQNRRFVLVGTMTERKLQDKS